MHRDHINAKMEVDLALLKSTKGVLKISEMVRHLYKFNMIVLLFVIFLGRTNAQQLAITSLNSTGIGLIHC